jgi:hypothetical protein
LDAPSLLAGEGGVNLEDHVDPEQKLEWIQEYISVLKLVQQIKPEIQCWEVLPDIQSILAGRKPELDSVRAEVTEYLKKPRPFGPCEIVKPEIPLPWWKRFWL